MCQKRPIHVSKETYTYNMAQGSLLSIILLKCYQLGLFDVVVQAAVLTAATVASVRVM